VRFSSNPDETYENRKACKRNLKSIQNFTVESPNTLITKITDAHMIVPNFFTPEFTLQKFASLNPTDKSANFFLNSYMRMTLPLSTNLRMREKLNKLFDK